jgi:hypothetical protein
MLTISDPLAPMKEEFYFLFLLIFSLTHKVFLPPAMFVTI